ncbi:hypothetical protein BK004_00525 [bacterium CG10_46_32]|nr:MAG: hypothetical protein BK004_00525 [bacterium CG10_46_32]
MKIKQHARIAAQSLLATFFVALIIVSATQAATTIGNNISTGTVTATTITGTAISGTTVTTSDIVDITATTDTPLTVNGGTSSTTLAVYQSSTGDILNLFDGSTEVFSVLDGGNVGVASSTPNATLAVQAAAGKTPFMVGSTTAELFTINASGVTVGNEDGLSFADFRWEGGSLSNLLQVDASADRVGIASTTPWGLLAIEQATESNSFLVMNQGSSTASFVVKGVNGNGRVGIATSSPSAMLSIGGASATSTLSMDKFCMYAGQENGVHVYVYLATSAANNSPFATTTTSCF